MFEGNKIMNKIEYLIRGYSEDEPKLVPSPKQRKRKRAERKKFLLGVQRRAFLKVNYES